jgi:hypothetical protein
MYLTATAGRNRSFVNFLRVGAVPASFSQGPIAKQTRAMINARCSDEDHLSDDEMIVARSDSTRWHGRE